MRTMVFVSPFHSLVRLPDSRQARGSREVDLWQIHGRTLDKRFRDWILPCVVRAHKNKVRSDENEIGAVSAENRVAE
jgi:hypothetical protein